MNQKDCANCGDSTRNRKGLCKDCNELSKLNDNNFVKIRDTSKNGNIRKEWICGCGIEYGEIYKCFEHGKTKNSKYCPIPTQTESISDKFLDDDDIGGLMCRPPGMTVKQVKDFNNKFRSMSTEDQHKVISDISDILKKK